MQKIQAGTDFKSAAALFLTRFPEFPESFFGFESFEVPEIRVETFPKFGLKMSSIEKLGFLFISLELESVMFAFMQAL